MHPVRLCCENSEYPDIPAFLRLAGRAPQPPRLRTYFFVNPKDLDPLTIAIDPNFAKAGGLQSPGVKGEAVISYRNPLRTQDLKSSGFPRCFQGKQHGKIDPILRIHLWGYPRNNCFAMIFIIITVY